MKKLFSFSILAVLLLCSQVGFARERYLKVTNNTTSTRYISLAKMSSTAPDGAIEISVDGGVSWNTYTASTNYTSSSYCCAVPKQTTALIRGKLVNFKSTSTSKCTGLYMSTAMDVSGSILALIDNGEGTADYIPSDVTFQYFFYPCASTIKNVSDELFEGIERIQPSCFGYMFYNCTALTHAPALLCPNLENNCYQYMFQGCTSLVDAPAISATVLAENCFQYMFSGCTFLANVPDLPATQAATGCYQYMFQNCIRLVTPPAIALTTTASSCCSSMFSGCTELTSAPTLSATIMTSSCYASMFSGCTSLATAPALPATVLATSCYSSMFSGCSKLTSAPNLPATEAVGSCYRQMFYNCSKLVTPPTIAATNTASSCFYGMFYGCASLTSAPNLSAANVASSAYYNMFWGCKSLINAPTMAATQIESSGCYAMFSGCSALEETPDLSAVESIGGSGCYQMFYNCTSLTSTSDLNATVVGESGYYGMFQGCSELLSGPTTIAPTQIGTNTCYNMFYNCSKLATAPTLPSMSVGQYGYYGMFRNCTALVKAPELPATTIDQYAYEYMFAGCTALTTAPTILPATTLANWCYTYMFDGCTNLKTVPSLPATTAKQYCYQYMFRNCSSITRAPVINFTTIKGTTYSGCLNGMFYNCSSLAYIEVKFTAWGSSYSETTDWVLGVAATGIFIKPSGLTATYDKDHIPTGWTLGSNIVYTFDLQGFGTWDGTNSDTKQFYSPQPTTEPAVVPNKGYMFTKWNDKADGSGSDFNVSSKPGVSTTFFAQYGTVSEFEEVSWTASSVVIKTTLPATNAKVQVFGSNSSIENSIASCQLAGDAGVYNLTFPSDLLNAAGQFAIISFTNGGTNIGKFSVRIPNLVTAAKTASQLPVNTELDTWVCNGATLTVDMNSEYKNVYVAGGAKLVVPSGKTLTAKNLILRAGGISNGTYLFRYPQLVANGSVNVASSNVYYEYLLNNAQFYSFSLPYTVNVNAITYLDNSPATFYFGAQQYNGEIRKSGNTTGWEYLWNPKEPVATYPDLQANKGYTVFGVPQKVTMERAAEAVRRKYCYLRFPLNADLTDGEAVPGTTKDIPVFAYGMTNNVLDDGVLPNDAGWNLVGNPYMADFNSIDGLTSTNGIGLLTQSGEGYIWTGTLRYIVIPNDNGTVYTPYLASGTDAAVIPAFKNYFVQIGTGDALQFAVANRVQQAPAEMLVDNEIMAGLQVSGNGKTDDIALLISDDYTSNYEINADLAKWMNNGLNLYSTVGGYNLSVAAMDAASAEKAIPVTIQTTAKGTYTFALSNKWSKNIENIEHLYLYDAQTQTYTDIKNDNYSFQAANAGVINNRFFVSATGAKSPTILDNTRACMILPGDGVISLRGLDNQANVSIYNGAGARVFGAKVNVNTIDIPLSQGVYVVNVENNGKTSQKTCLVF